MVDERTVRVKVNADRIAKGVELYVDGDSAVADRWEFDDNCLDVVPGEELPVTVRFTSGEISETVHQGETLYEHMSGSHAQQYENILTSDDPSLS